ncbi:hypothetical protein QQF64_030085 [Cirrhinus molitorella]|uniref:Secreted protein n=1 Tax=Cirrhinus molitorella TaxID=172907 RepID=A0ABR3N2F2_9TELE
MDRVTGPFALRRCCLVHSLTSLCRAGGAPTHRSTHTHTPLLTSIQLDSASLSEDDRDYCGAIHEPNLHQPRRVESEPRRERESNPPLSRLSPSSASTLWAANRQLKTQRFLLKSSSHPQTLSCFKLSRRVSSGYCGSNFTQGIF